LFTLKSYYAICAGLKIFDKNIASQTFQSLTQGITYNAYINIRNEYFKNLNEIIPNLKTHKQYIKKMKV
jgi:hypothetical protein